MSVSAQEVAARQSEKIARDLIAAVNATPEERLTWLPLGTGRTILDQLIECSVANLKWTRILQVRAWETLTREEIAAAGVADDLARDGAIALLEKTTAALVATIRSIGDDEAAREMPLPWKPEVTRTLAEACFHAYWNMAYHEGQICYVQTLYGDAEEHADSGPFGE